MLRITYERIDLCAIIEIIPGPQHNEDWQQCADLLRLMDEDAARQGRDWMIFVLTSPGSQRPDANWRRRFAEMRGVYKCKQRCMILVSNSVLFRGALSAINLLAPNSDGTNYIVGSIEDGVEKAERWRDSPMPMLRRLEAFHPRGIAM